MISLLVTGWLLFYMPGTFCFPHGPPDIDRGSTPRVGLSYCGQGWTHHTGSCDVQFIFGVGGGGTGYSAMEDPTLDIITRETLCVAKDFGTLRIAYFLLQI